MPFEIAMPQMGLTMEAGTILHWLKQVGDAVRRDEPLLEIETDKTAVEVTSDAEGVLLTILVPEGKAVPVGTVLGWIGQAGEVVGAVEGAHRGGSGWQAGSPRVGGGSHVRHPRVGSARHPGGSWRGSRWHTGSLWHHGGFHSGGWGWHGATRVFIGHPGWWGPGWWGAPYPYYVAPPVVVPPPPTAYIQQEPAPSTENYWYYCQDAGAYYPYVKECPGGWTQMVPQPAPPSQ